MRGLQYSQVMRVDAESIGLAVKYRPRNFQELIGQKEVKKVLNAFVNNGKIPQQILFSGGSGLGKTTIARVFASMILCHADFKNRENLAPCNECESCIEIFSSSSAHPDLIEFDAASNGGKDEIREIAQRAMLSPVMGSKKIYIIDEAHGLSNPGGQAFLKLLEEPPAHVIFMLCTTDPEKMLKTNRGRCIEFRLKNPSKSELLSNLEKIVLKENSNIGQDVLELVVDASDPELGVRGTVVTLGKVIGNNLGVKLSKEEAELILGLPPKSEVRKLISYLVAEDRVMAFKHLDILVDSFGASLLRKTLIEIVRDEVLLEVNSSSDRLIKWYKTLLESESSKTGLEYFVVSALINENPIVDPASSTRARKEDKEVYLENMDAVEKIVSVVSVSDELKKLLMGCEVKLGKSDLIVSAPKDIAPLMAIHYNSLRAIAQELNLEAKFNKAD